MKIKVASAPSLSGAYALHFILRYNDINVDSGHFDAYGLEAALEW